MEVSVAMKPSDLLFLFIQIVVTLAGFTGVVALIDRGAARVSDEIASFRVRWLIAAALSVVVLGTLPFFAILFGLPENDVWRWGCLIAGSYTLYWVIAVNLKLRSFKGAKGLGISIFQYYIVMAVFAVGAAVLAAGFLGFTPTAPSYSVGVFVFVLVVAIFFMRLVFMLDESSRNINR
jgi:hypothetical protein